ncbi:PEP-CTERM sorting domain-containing protein [Cerasicoccus frondis]|uniref:PEP-CTERM sorting domain-containing protein n=1 Tax=Cerasicoccus frondis TaxID=490090 RepID=UPI00285266F1|nr:PEP-CTERM sorting domain-containing protein [Cerasicoccus frondis]
MTNLLMQKVARTSVFTGILTLSAFPLAVAANLNLFENGSFETTTPYLDYLLESSDSVEIPVSDPYDPGTYYLPGWGNRDKTYLSESAYSNITPVAANDGNYFLLLGAGINEIGVAIAGGIQQSVTLSAGVTYQFSFDQYVLEEPLIAPYPNQQRFIFGFESEDFYWTQSLQTTTGVVKQTYGSSDIDDATETFYEEIAEAGAWVERIVQFTPTVDGDYDFFFELLSTGSNPTVSSQKIFVDNFSLVAVPEPETYATLLGVGALAAVAWRRKRRFTA